MKPPSQHDISRRRFVQAGLAASVSGALTAATPRRPNILYVFSDMQRATSIGAYGDPNVRTPALDRFTSQSTRFGHLAMKYPDAKTIHLVMDNLNIHRRKSSTNVFGVEIGNEIWD